LTLFNKYHILIFNNYWKISHNYLGAFVSRWFANKEIALAFGIQLCISRLGSVIGGWMLPALYTKTEGLFWPLMAACLFCVMSLICAFIINYMDVRNEDTEENFEPEDNAEAENINFSDIKKLSGLFWLLAFTQMLHYISLMIFL